MDLPVMAPRCGVTRTPQLAGGVPRQLFLPVHLLGLAPLLSSVGAVAGDVKLQDDGVWTTRPIAAGVAVRSVSR